MYFKIFLLCSLIAGSYCQPLPFTNELGSAFQNLWTDFLSRIERMTQRFQETLNFMSNNFRPPFITDSGIGGNNNGQNGQNVVPNNVENILNESQNTPSIENNGNKEQSNGHNTVENVIKDQLPPNVGKPFAQVAPHMEEVVKTENVPKPALKVNN